MKRSMEKTRNPNPFRPMTPFTHCPQTSLSFRRVLRAGGGRDAVEDLRAREFEDSDLPGFCVYLKASQGNGKVESTGTCASRV
jgi:hypothetical protein